MALVAFGMALGITCRVEDVVHRKCLDPNFEQGGALIKELTFFFGVLISTITIAVFL